MELLHPNAVLFTLPQLNAKEVEETHHLLAGLSQWSKEHPVIETVVVSGGGQFSSLGLIEVANQPNTEEASWLEHPELFSFPHIKGVVFWVPTLWLSTNRHEYRLAIDQTQGRLFLHHIDNPKRIVELLDASEMFLLDRSETGIKVINDQGYVLFPDETEHFNEQNKRFLESPAVLPQGERRYGKIKANPQDIGRNVMDIRFNEQLRLAGGQIIKERGMKGVIIDLATKKPVKSVYEQPFRFLTRG